MRKTFRDVRVWLAALLLAVLAQDAAAGQVEIVHARFTKEGDGWLVAVTLRHADTGWDHYADGWQVVGANGKVLGHRTLFHPHVDEQPFTRSLMVRIPDSVLQVFIEAHDKVHGWSAQRLAVDLTQASGPGYEVQR